MAMPTNFTSFSYNDLSEKLRHLRELLHSTSPAEKGLSALGNLAGGPMLYALQGAAQGDVLHDPQLMKRLAQDFGGQQPPQSPDPASAVPGGLPGMAADMTWQNFDHRSANMPGMEAGLQRLGQERLGAAPEEAPQAPWWADGRSFGSPDAQAPAPQQTAAAPSAAPMPQPRPADAPQPQPDTSFFMRNALMMQDPNGGGFIDPQGASSVRGPDLINKMMAYLHNKDIG